MRYLHARQHKSPNVISRRQRTSLDFSAGLIIQHLRITRRLIVPPIFRILLQTPDCSAHDGGCWTARLGCWRCRSTPTAPSLPFSQRFGLFFGYADDFADVRDQDLTGVIWAAVDHFLTAPIFKRFVVFSGTTADAILGFYDGSEQQNASLGEKVRGRL